MGRISCDRLTQHWLCFLFVFSNSPCKKKPGHQVSEYLLDLVRRNLRHREHCFHDAYFSAFYPLHIEHFRFMMRPLYRDDVRRKLLTTIRAFCPLIMHGSSTTRAGKSEDQHVYLLRQFRSNSTNYS